ncbi:MAG: hypothetical protein HC850_10970 [Rhodomicrobium sp.]|nr:hypothetical protein [Rhodomicrobium sp.]
MPDDSRAARQVANLSHPGLLAIRRAWDSSAKKFRQSIAIDDIRAVRHFLQRTAVTPWRVVIVDSADDLNLNSANALLKSLEERRRAPSSCWSRLRPAGCCRRSARAAGRSVSKRSATLIFVTPS